MLAVEKARDLMWKVPVKRRRALVATNPIEE
jgi:hypothetical protein